MKLEISIGDTKRPSLAFNLVARDYGDALEQTDRLIAAKYPQLAKAPINFKPVRDV